MADHVCETCGQTDEVLTVCQDTFFCRACWADFGTDRWKGIGSRLPAPEKESEEKR